MTLDRRTLLKGGLATGLGALGTSLLEGPVTAATLQGSLPKTVDVVVGAGEATDPEVHGPSAEEPVLEAGGVQGVGGAGERSRLRRQLQRRLTHPCPASSVRAFGQSPPRHEVLARAWTAGPDREGVSRAGARTGR